MTTKMAKGEGVLFFTIILIDLYVMIKTVFHNFNEDRYVMIKT
jgi:hypothetical protein